MIEYYITDINHSVCQPNECPENGFANDKEVEHFKFDGDGGDLMEFANDAPPKLVHEYMGYCERQVVLAKMYLKSIEEKENENGRTT